MVQLEKFVPVRGVTLLDAPEGRPRSGTFELPRPADPDPAVSYEPQLDTDRGQSVVIELSDRAPSPQRA